MVSIDTLSTILFGNQKIVIFIIIG